MTNSPWVPQEDGTFQPSAELLEAIRANPEKFPNAVEDIAAISGKSREEAQAIIHNPMRSGSGSLASYVAPMLATSYLTDAVREGAKGVSIGLKKVGEVTGIDTLKGAGEWVEEQANTLFDPAMDTERGVGEKIAGVVGQATPAVAAGVMTGGAGGILAGAAVTSLTFEDEDNLIQLADEWTGGAMPDFLVINDEDTPETSLVKGFAANLITDALLAAPVLGVKLYQYLKSVPTEFVDMNTLKQLSDEVGVPLREGPANTDDLAKALDNVASQVSRETKHSPEQVAKTQKAHVREKVAAEALQQRLGVPIKDAPQNVPAPPKEDVDNFIGEVLRPVQHVLDLSKQRNPSLKSAIDSAETGATSKAYREHAAKFYEAVHVGNIEDALTLLRSADQLPRATSLGHTYVTSLLRQGLLRLEAKAGEVLEYIRANPQVRTDVAWRNIAAGVLKDKTKLGEVYRELGTASSSAMNTRKGVLFKDHTLKALKEAERDIAEELSEMGINLTTTKNEFVLIRSMELDEMGIDPVGVLDDLYRQFDEFDKARQAVLANRKDNALSRLSPEEKALMESSWLRAFHDLHSSSLLGQPSTAGLEALSNTLNNVLQPITQHILTRGDFRRAFREYAGYRLAFNRSWQVFKAAYARGKGVLDDFDITENPISGYTDYDALKDQGKYLRYLGLRMWKFAADLSIASSESSKAMRAVGIAYADGYNLALKAGNPKGRAKKLALEYANSKFDEKGALVDPSLKITVQDDLWQGVIDTRYALGKMAQQVDNWRNSSNPAVSIVARMAVPFWRTLINIGSHSMQTIQPIPASVIKAAARTKYGEKFVKTFKFVDDLTGANGYHAQQRAIGRQRLGYMMMGSAYMAAEMGLFDITGPAGHKRWDAKKAAFQEYPPSSLIIGGKAIDLTRLLPFSAPLMLVGLMRDAKREHYLEMKDGMYVNDTYRASDWLSDYGTGLLLLSFNLMSDAASLRGMGDMIDNILTIAENPTENTAKTLNQVLKDYAKQWTPGLIRAAGKNQGVVTGDWTQYESEEFLGQLAANAGFKYNAYAKIDFLGKPVDDDYWRGVDPSNTKPVRTDDPLRAEYVMLNRAGDLGISLGKPSEVFGKADWKNAGYHISWVDELLGKKHPSLFDLETIDGQNAWQKYQRLVYESKATKDIKVKVGSGTGDRVPLGSVTIRQGENFEAALRRITASDGYQKLTPDARAKVWRELFSFFKKTAKEEIAKSVVVPAGTFTREDRYGPLTTSPETLDVLFKLGKEKAAEVQTTRGNPLDDVFSIS